MDDDERPEQADHDEPANSNDAARESNDELADEFAEDLDGLSMDDLGAAYARVAAEHDPEAFAQPEEAVPEDETSETDTVDEAQEESDEDEALVTPEAIVEAALFVGHPENKRFTEQRLASLMRDVSPEEVVLLIDQLNESYKEFFLNYDRSPVLIVNSEFLDLAHNQNDYILLLDKLLEYFNNPEGRMMYFNPSPSLA